MFKNVRRAALVAGVALTTLTGTTAAAQADSATSAPAGFTATSQAVEPASGDFTASVDVSTFMLENVGNKCLLMVSGTLEFTGTLTGQAEGTTTALVFAPCSEAGANPPGTFYDLFRFEGSFSGTVDGVPVTGDLTYAGVTHPGGEIDAAIVLRGAEASAVLDADAVVLVGGSYRGVASAR